MVMGTPQYLSPEQALGKTVDHRSDLYATGCLLYELLALRPPFTGETPLSVVYQHVQDQPRIPSQVNNRVPPELDGMVLRALAKQPEDRFQSAEEMRGVVGYAHQALAEQGGWSGGRWNTGAVTAIAPGPGTAPTVIAQGGPRSGGNTAEFGMPLLAGVAGTGGPDDVHGYGAPPPPGGNRWLKPVLFAIVAVIVVALGVLLANHGQGNGGGSPADSVSPSVTQNTGPADDQPSDLPSDTGEVSTGPAETTTGRPTETTTKTTPPPTTAPTTTPPPTTPPTSKPTTADPTTTPPTTPPTSKPATTEPTTPEAPPTDVS
jgi:serine/threonine protein kinase